MRKTKFLGSLLVTLTLAFGFLGCTGGDAPTGGSTADIPNPGQQPPGQELREYLIVAERGIDYDATVDNPLTLNVTETAVDDMLDNVAIFEFSGIGQGPIPNGILTRADDAPIAIGRTDSTVVGGVTVGTHSIAADPLSNRVITGLRDRDHTSPIQRALQYVIAVDDLFVQPFDVEFPPMPILQPPAAAANVFAAGDGADFSSARFHPGGSFYVEAVDYINLGSFLTIVRYNAAIGALDDVSAQDIPLAADCREMAITPDGRFIYVASASNGSISGFQIDTDTGAVGSLGNFTTGGVGTYGVAVDRTGSFLYCTNYASGDITGFAINADGTLTQISVDGVAAPGPFNYGAVNPCGIAFSPTADVLIITDRAGNAMSSFTIDTGTGVITQAGPVGAVPNGAGLSDPVNVIIEPTGNFAVIACAAQFSYDANGLIQFNQFLDFDPTTLNPLTGGLARFRIAPDGALSFEQSVVMQNPYGMGVLPLITPTN